MPPKKIKTLSNWVLQQKDTRAGMGMGLINAYNIIQNHKGELKVESEVGKAALLRSFYRWLWNEALKDRVEVNIQHITK